MTGHRSCRHKEIESSVHVLEDLNCLRRLVLKCVSLVIDDNINLVLKILSPRLYWVVAFPARSFEYFLRLRFKGLTLQGFTTLATRPALSVWLFRVRVVASALALVLPFLFLVVHLGAEKVRSRHVSVVFDQRGQAGNNDVSPGFWQSECIVVGTEEIRLDSFISEHSRVGAMSSLPVLFGRAEVDVHAELVRDALDLLNPLEHQGGRYHHKDWFAEFVSNLIIYSVSKRPWSQMHRYV